MISASAALGKNRDVPDSLKYLFYNNIYFRYSKGFNVYLKDVKKGYYGLSDDEIRFGRTEEPEIGTFIKDFMQIGIAYLYMNGVSESIIGANNNKRCQYDDVFFSGGVIKARYFLLNRENIKIPIGIEGIIGICRLKSGSTNDLDKVRGMHNYEASGDYEARGFGGGLFGTFSYYPAWYLSMGIDAGFRIIKSKKLIDLYYGGEFKDYNGEAQTLNFSSMNIKAYVSLQF